MADDNDHDNWLRYRQKKDIGAAYTGALRPTLVQNHHSQTDYHEAACGINLQNGLQTWTKPRCTRSGPEVSFINPAIYAESCYGDADGDADGDGIAAASGIGVQLKVDEEKLSDDWRHSVKNSIRSNCGDSNIGIEQLSALSIKNDVASSLDGCGGGERTSQDTYRCLSSNSAIAISSSQSEASTVRSRLTVTPRESVRVERRCRIGEKINGDCSAVVPLSDVGSSVQRNEQPDVQRYTVNGHRVVHMSASMSNSNISEHQIETLDGVTLARRIAHEEWLRRKREHAERKKVDEDRENEKKRMEEERLERERRDKELRERESFLRWSERKKKEEADKKAAMEKELELQLRLKEIEEKAAVAKALCLRQWVRKKDEEKKAHQKKQQLKQKITEEEKKKRLEENSKAFEKWRETAKNRPKPATQGLLSYQKAKPGYINPTPWQGVIDDDPEKEDNVLTISRRSRTDQSRRNDKK